MVSIDKGGMLTPVKRRRPYTPPKHICGAPCRYGGLNAVRKYSRAELGAMFRCNRGVAEPGDRCWQHPSEKTPAD